MARNWAKIHTGWARQNKMRKMLRKYGPVAGSYYWALMTLAKECSHHKTNPEGRVKTSVGDLAHDLYDRHDRTEMWADFIDAGLVVIEGEWQEHETATFFLPDFVTDQVPTGGTRDRKQKQRDTQGNVTTMSQDVTTVSQNVTTTSHNRQDKTRQDKTKKTIHTSGSDKPNTDQSAAIREVFAHWQQATGKTKTNLTRDRKLKIAARLREGYTVDQLKQAADGYAASPFHRGENDRGKTYLDVDLVYRNAGKVDAGIELAEGPQGGQPPRKEWKGWD